MDLPDKLRKEILLKEAERKSTISLCDYIKKYSSERDREYQLNLLEILSSKIKVIKKHGQSEKTQLVIEHILNNIDSNVVICITKNTLLSSSQFLERFIKETKKKLNTNNIKDNVIILNSSDEVSDDYTHCSNIDKVISILSRDNDVKIIFMCCNNVRMDDVDTFLNSYNNFKNTKNVEAHLDEAHNYMNTYRHKIEKWLLYSFVEAFVPCSASSDPIHFNDKLWKQLTTLDYHDKFKTKSTDDTYFGINNMINIEEEGYEVPHTSVLIPTGIWNKCYPKKEYVNNTWSTCQYKKQIETQILGDEQTHFNHVKEIYTGTYQDTDDDTIEFPLLIPNRFNLHMLLCPMRIVSHERIKDWLLTHESKPNVLVINSGKSIFYHKDGGYIKKYELKKGEINVEIENTLKLDSVDRNKPLIIAGNWKSLGESITFVNRDYGNFRSICIPNGIDLNREVVYQFLLRDCFMLSKWGDDNKHTLEKEVYCICSKEHYKMALDYEKLNDRVIDDISNGITTTESSVEVVQTQIPEWEPRMVYFDTCTAAKDYYKKELMTHFGGRGPNAIKPVNGIYKNNMRGVIEKWNRQKLQDNRHFGLSLEDGKTKHRLRVFYDENDNNKIKYCLIFK